jgi:tRNA uridine 5-carboxymethylaminomethyl modification enzyme
MKNFDIIIIGGGHAGVEAACIARQFNLNIAIITLPEIGLASAPCNPSIGGVGKGQVVREIDALGGVMGKLADSSGIQYRILNESKGFAVQSTRVQIDRDIYSENAEKLVLERGIKVIRDQVTQVIRIDDGSYEVKSQDWSYRTKKIIVTVGTFLNGKLHTGKSVESGGRYESSAVCAFEDIFSFIKVAPQRFKTGTPARILKSSINYENLDEQPSDISTLNFHFDNLIDQRELEQVSCFLTYTNENTMTKIRENLSDSPMFSGQIKGVGARYCPSIEDKANRYPEKHIHHVFLEPEGLKADTVYPSGISTSLKKDVQEIFYKTIEGLENCKIKVYGYAVEYDVVDTTKLNQTLEYIDFPGLYFAGQVNGTSGYEEAAGQGLIAGANAALSLGKKTSLILDRNDSYIGVMIQDLISNLRDEPYRLFTARSENRLFIREDNAVSRMHAYRISLGLETGIEEFQRVFLASAQVLESLCESYHFDPLNEFVALQLKYGLTLTKRLNISEFLKQSVVNPIELLGEIVKEFGFTFDKRVVNAVAISQKYSGYIDRSNSQNDRLLKLDKKKIKWTKLMDSENISYECKQRIEKIKPETFGQLKLIEGIRPASLAFVAGNYL